MVEDITDHFAPISASVRLLPQGASSVGSLTTGWWGIGPHYPVVICSQQITLDKADVPLPLQDSGADSITPHCADAERTRGVKGLAPVSAANGDGASDPGHVVSVYT